MTICVKPSHCALRNGNNLVTTNIPLSGTRLWDSMMKIARIGATAKGRCNRQTLTDLDGEGRALFPRWGEAAGLTLSVDCIGNMVFRRPGRASGPPSD
jgi:N-carbamoyl-L-amino-acid hydrolase